MCTSVGRGLHTLYDQHVGYEAASHLSAAKSDADTNCAPTAIVCLVSSVRLTVQHACTEPHNSQVERQTDKANTITIKRATIPLSSLDLLPLLFQQCTALVVLLLLFGSHCATR